RASARAPRRSGGTARGAGGSPRSPRAPEGVTRSRDVFELVAELLPAAMRIALRSADGHSRHRGDLLEGEAERVLPDDDLRVGRGQLGQAATELRAQLGEV